jgi:hypothetical protein
MLVSVALFFFSSHCLLASKRVARCDGQNLSSFVCTLYTTPNAVDANTFDVFHICIWASFLSGSFGRLIFSEFLFIFGFLFGLSTRTRTLKETREVDGGSCKTSIPSLWKGHAFFLLCLVQVWQESIDCRRLSAARSQGGFYAEAAAIQEIAGKGEKLVELLSGVE